LIRLTEVLLGPEVEALVIDVVRSGQLAQGPMVARLEELGAAMAGCRHAVALSSGTAALEAALEVTGIGPGDEVITTPFTFAATVNAVLRTGATARFADIRDDYTIDPDAVAALVNPRTAAVVPVHLYGLMADMPAVAAVAARRGLVVIEDAAQAHGASLDGRPAGSFGLGCFSFYATKNIAAGEGGLVTTSDDGLARRLRLLRNQGMVERYQYEMLGRNLRLTDLQAAVAIPQMERLEELTAKRQANAKCLTGALVNSGVETPACPAGRDHVWHQYTIRLPGGVDREQVQVSMRAAGVETGVYYPRLAWDYPIYRSHPGIVGDDTPTARRCADRCLSLPIHPGLVSGDTDTVAAALMAALDR
jgi:perosamine synthetase